MSLGYHKPLYLLPFDHRQSYVGGMFGFAPPLSVAQHDQVRDSKQLIYQGFRLAVGDRVPNDLAGVLIDEAFGAEILCAAKARGYVTALATEQSGAEEFFYAYGADFAHHIELFDPTFAKVLVRYNPQGDRALNQRQTERLLLLSDYCHRRRCHFMFELLVPATVAQMDDVGGDKKRYDTNLRPLLMVQAMRALQEAGVEPDVWNVEGLALRADCERIVDTARRGGRDEIACIVLGRGEDQAQVLDWLRTAASVPGYIGFAVGRASYWDAVAGYGAQTLSYSEAVAQIAQHMRQWIDIFELARITRNLKYSA